MSDRTYLRTYVFACPASERPAALGVLCPGAGPGDQLILDESYEEEEVPCGYSADLAAALAAAAPGASFVMWEDPGTVSPGELHARTPGLGDFTGDCTAAGDVVITLDEILEILGDADSLAAARAGLHRRMAGPWMDNWARAQPRNNPGSTGATAPQPASAVDARLTGIEPGDLDDLVHDAASQAASAINNAGPAAQLTYLTEAYGPAAVAALTSQNHEQPAARPENR